jgi:hypothetical protein
MAIQHILKCDIFIVSGLLCKTLFLHKGCREWIWVLKTNLDQMSFQNVHTSSGLIQISFEVKIWGTFLKSLIRPKKKYTYVYQSRHSPLIVHNALWTRCVGTTWMSLPWILRRLANVSPFFNSLSIRPRITNYCLNTM